MFRLNGSSHHQALYTIRVKLRSSVRDQMPGPKGRKIQQKDNRTRRLTITHCLIQVQLLVTSRAAVHVVVKIPSLCCIPFQKIILFSPMEHNNTFIMYIVTATCFGLFCRPSSVNTLHTTQICVWRNNML